MYQHTIRESIIGISPTISLLSAISTTQSSMHPFPCNRLSLSHSHLHIPRPEYKMARKEETTLGGTAHGIALNCISQWCTIIWTASFSAESRYIALVFMSSGPLVFTTASNCLAHHIPSVVALPYAYRPCPRVALRDEFVVFLPVIQLAFLHILFFTFIVLLTPLFHLPAANPHFIYCTLSSSSVPSSRHRQCCNIARRLIAPLHHCIRL